MADIERISVQEAHAKTKATKPCSFAPMRTRLNANVQSGKLYIVPQLQGAGTVSTKVAGNARCSPPLELNRSFPRQQDDRIGR